MRNPSIIAILLLFAFGVVRPAFAQNDPDPPEEKFSSLVSFVALQRDMPQLFARSGDEFEPLTVRPFRRSPLYGLRGNEITLYAEAPTDSEKESTDGKTPVATIKVDGGIERAMVFLRAARGKLGSAVLNDGFDVHPPGKVRVLNLTEMPIAIDLGGEPLRAPDRQPVLGDDRADKFGYVSVKVAVQKSDESLQAARDTYRAGDDDARVFILVRRQTPEQFLRSDEPPPEEEEETDEPAPPPPDPSRYNDKILLDILRDTTRPDAEPSPSAILE